MKNPHIIKARYILGLLFCLSIISIKSSAQDEALSQFSTGNADAMSIFGKYPQVGYTGVPDINVPLYNFTCEDLSFPLILSYNNNLVKPYSMGSWVGLGWNLSGGGVITRTVNGKPDDLNWYKKLDYDRTHDTNMGYYYNHSYLTDNWTDETKMKTAFNDLYNIFDYHTDFGHGPLTTFPSMRDYAPDEFYFSVADISGYFYLDDHGNWKVKSKNKVKVVITSGDFDEVTETYPTPNQNYIRSITLIDNRGITYRFGGWNSQVEDVRSSSTDPNLFINTWYISRITFPNGKYVTFNYTAGNDVSFSQPIAYHNGSVVTSTQVTHSTHLSTITSDLYTISFITSQPSGHYLKLDTLKITNTTNPSSVKQFAFSYTLTNTNSYKLANVKQVDHNNNVGTHYAFQYNSQSFDSIKVHSNTDHWGYYNTKAIVTNHLTTPGTPFNWAGYIHSRSRDTAHCRAEMLERIVYPTGGYTQYTWEPNSYKYSVDVSNALVPYTSADSDLQAGGVRIRQINNYDSNNIKTSSKQYFYVKNFSLSGLDTASSSGILHLLPRTFVDENVVLSFSPVSYILGAESHVNYSSVTEMNNDGSYTTTTYSNSDNGYGNAPYAKYVRKNNAQADISSSLLNPVYSSNVQERGAPLHIVTHTSTGAPLSEKIYTYTTVIDGVDYVKGYDFVATGDTYNEYLTYGWYGSAFRIFTNNFLPATLTEKLYNNSTSPITTITTYSYDTAVVNLTKISVAGNSKRQTVETDYLYPYDMVHSSQDPTGIYAAMVAAHTTSPLIETVKKLNSTQLTLSKADYKAHTAGLYNFYRADSSIIKYGMNTPKTIDKYTTYDNQGNLITEVKNGILPTTYIYDYTGTFVVAKIVNATRDEILFEDFENPLSYSAPGTLGLSHSGSHYHLERGSGVSPYYLNFTIPDSRQYVVSFWYHISGNKWTYKKEPYSGASFIVPDGANAIDDVCVYPADAQVTTYGYDPLAGLTNMTDTKGVTIYYEYDDLQRLVNIKDQDGNIKTHYCYNYAGQETDCTVPFVPSLSPPPDPPAPPYSPYGVYARLEISDVANEYYGSGDETSIYQTGNVCVKIYSDPACTMPLTLDHDLTIGLTFTTNQVDDGIVTNTDTEDDIYTIPTGQNSYCLGSMDLDDFTNFLDEDNNSHYEEFIYGYAMQTTSPYYAVTPTVYP